MKHVFKVFIALLLAVVPLSLIAQNPTVILEYMKVTQESESTYLEVEQAWKKIHQKRIELGLSAGWQLWRNVYAGYNDPYQYITANWYSDYAQSFKPMPEGFYEGFMNGEDAEILNKTAGSRVLASKQVTHQVSQATNNPGNSTLIWVNQMHVQPGMGSAYVELETTIFKPIHEEAIKRGERAHWSLWMNWPLKEGQAEFVTVDGFVNGTQLTGSGSEDLFSVVHPSLSADETYAKIEKARTLSSAELWELVESVFPEQ